MTKEKRSFALQQRTGAICIDEVAIKVAFICFAACGFSGLVARGLSSEAGL